MYKLIKPTPQSKGKKKGARAIVDKALSSKAGKQMANPSNWMGAGRVVNVGKSTAKFMGKGKPLDKALIKRLQDSAGARAFQNDIDMYQAKLARQRQIARQQAQEVEKRKSYFLSTYPEQRYRDAINKFKNR